MVQLNQGGDDDDDGGRGSKKGIQRGAKVTNVQTMITEMRRANALAFLDAIEDSVLSAAKSSIQ